MDIENNRKYAMDAGPGKTISIDLDQETGNMTLAWSAENETLS
jgi:hypothetical protein